MTAADARRTRGTVVDRLPDARKSSPGSPAPAARATPTLPSEPLRERRYFEIQDFDDGPQAAGGAGEAEPHRLVGDELDPPGRGEHAGRWHVFVASGEDHGDRFPANLDVGVENTPVDVRKGDLADLGPRAYNIDGHRLRPVRQSLRRVGVEFDRVAVAGYMLVTQSATAVTEG